jgi:Family of unknown function (DUF6412)
LLDLGPEVPVLAALSQVAGHLLAVLMWADTPQRAAVVAVAVLAVAAVAVVGCLAAGATPAAAAALPVTRRVAALRDKSWRVAFLRQRDPGARGRSRPRAPTAAPAAA